MQSGNVATPTYASYRAATALTGIGKAAKRAFLVYLKNQNKALRAIPISSISKIKTQTVHQSSTKIEHSPYQGMTHIV